MPGESLCNPYGIPLRDPLTAEETSNNFTLAISVTFTSIKEWLLSTTLLKKIKGGNTKIVQVNISAKAVSAIDSSLIAAKSDFATVKREYELSAELEAFDVTSQKLADFLLPSFHRYWEKGIQSPEEKEVIILTK